MLGDVRGSVYRNLFDVENGSATARRLDTFITWLIVANLAALVAEHIPTIYATHEASLGLFDRISIYFLSDRVP